MSNTPPLPDEVKQSANAGRSTSAKTAPTENIRLDFQSLLQAEDEQLEAARTGRRPTQEEFPHTISTPGAAQEPWVAFTNRDRVGLALSGGGIRSATFNLGLLQALNDKGVLKHVDYLSTVSGGGYVGGFWTAWKYRQDMLAEGSSPPEPPAFPSNASNNTADDSGAGAPEMRERKEIRHLREFSRFLMPRLSPDSVDLWSAVVTILGGMVPSLIFAAVVITCGWTFWLALAQLAGGEIAFGDGPATGGRAVAAAVVFAVVFVVQWGSEHLWRKQEPKDAGRERSRDIFVMGAMLAIVAGGMQLALLKTDWFSPGESDRAAERAPAASPSAELVVKLTLDTRPQHEITPRV